MKSLTRIIGVLLFMGSSLFLNATVDPTASIRSQKGHSFSLHVQDLNQEAFEIKFSDEKGITLINEKVERQEDYVKFFNLKNLPVGAYSLKIETARKVIVQNIEVLQESVSVDPANKVIIDKPTISYQASMLELNMVNLEKGQAIVKIQDKSGQVLHQESLQAIGKIKKQFDLRALPAGNYLVEVWTKYFTYEQRFSIESARKITADADQTYSLPYPTEAVKDKISWIGSGKN